MSRASIVTIGNEILTGHTINTNAAYLADRLLYIGISVVSCHTVSDDIDDIVKIINLSAQEAEVIIVTGGLGPTSDDVTREAIAKFLGVELQLDKRLLKKIEVFFSKRGLQMTANSRQQAYLPAGTKALDNNVGTAPGIRAVKDEKIIFALPGVPAELKAMFEEYVFSEFKNLVEQSNGQVTVVRKINCFGAGESNIAQMLGPLSARDRNPLINFTAGYGVITLHITATADDIEKASDLAEQDKNKLAKQLGEFVFGYDNQTLAEVVAQKLKSLSKTIAVAESCTGGILAGMLTELAGASSYFTYGWVTYSNDAKMTELGVPVDLIEKYGAVSREVAQVMAKGALQRAKSSVAIAITGIAGPEGGSEQKPVGCVYISVDSDFCSQTERFVFPGDRTSIRLRATNTALNMIRLILQKLTM